MKIILISIVLLIVQILAFALGIHIIPYIAFIVGLVLDSPGWMLAIMFVLADVGLTICISKLMDRILWGAIDSAVEGIGFLKRLGTIGIFIALILKIVGYIIGSNYLTSRYPFAILAVALLVPVIMLVIPVIIIC